MSQGRGNGGEEVGVHAKDEYAVLISLSNTFYLDLRGLKQTIRGTYCTHRERVHVSHNTSGMEEDAIHQHRLRVRAHKLLLFLSRGYMYSRSALKFGS